MPDSAPSRDLETQKRRSTRIIQAVPLTVAGVDALGRPFQERTSTLIINCHGCRYQSKHYVLKNMWVTLEIPHPETGREPRRVRARVTWIQRPRTVRELFQIGVELEVPGNVWGIAFPPESWFPFPETPTPEIPALGAEAEAQAQARDEEWVLPGTAARPDNLHVLPGPGGGEGPVAVARQVARLVVEAKQQLQNAAREATSQAVTTEMRPLLAAIHNQMKEAAEKAVQAAAAAQADEVIRQTTANIEEARQAGLEALREKWNSELQRHLREASPQLAEHLATIGQAHQASLEQQLETQFKLALEKLNKLSGELAESATHAEAEAVRFRRQLDESAQAAGQRWQETLQSRVEEAGARLEKLEKAAGELNNEIAAATASAQAGWRGRFDADLAAAATRWNEKVEEAGARLEKLEKAGGELNNEIAAATASAQAGWRGRLDADLAAAATRWNEKVEASLEGAAREAAERLAKHSQSATGKLEQELTLRVAALRQSFEQATAEAESALGTLRTALSKETTRARASLAEVQQAADQLGEHSARLEAMSQAAGEELQRRSEAILASESLELSRRAESAIAGMAERLQPVLEAAGQQSVARLAAQLEQELAAHLDRANQLLASLATTQAQAEEAARAHQEGLQQSSGQVVEAALARLQDTVGRFEKDFQEAGRAATAKWLAELETKATDTTHTTFEALYKASEWYEKKVQTHMQASIDKGLEQASNGLREKAGEISGLFASELDHYSRSYVEHTQGQMDEAVKEAVERARLQLAQAAETTAATLGDQIHGVALQEFERFTSSAASAVEQTAAHLETHLAQVRSRIDADARQFFVEFHKGMTQQVQQGVAQVRQELEAELTPVKEAWRVEREAQQQQLHEALAHLSNESIDAYKKRLENVSNAWVLATATKLSQQSQNLITTLASSAEQQLREACSRVFANVGETLRQRMLDFSAGLTRSNPPQEEK